MPRRKTDFRQVSKENYLLFCKLHPEIKLSLKEFQSIIYSFNFCFRDYILNTGELIRYPFGHGEFSINKKKTRRKLVHEGKEYIALPVDWKKTKEAKAKDPSAKKVYIFNSHTDGYRFKWLWIKKTARFANADLFNFSPYRVSSRLIKDFLIKPNSPYIELYKQYIT